MWRRPLLLGRVSPSGGDVGRGFFLALPASRTPVCTISAASLNTPRAIPAVGSAARSALVAAFVPFMRKLKRGSETAVTATEPARRERRLPSEPATDMPGGWVLVQGQDERHGRAAWGPAQRWQLKRAGATAPAQESAQRRPPGPLDVLRLQPAGYRQLLGNVECVSCYMSPRQRRLLR